MQRIDRMDELSQTFEINALIEGGIIDHFRPSAVAREEDACICEWNGHA
jgi:hypothetical protein